MLFIVHLKLLFGNLSILLVALFFSLPTSGLFWYVVDFFLFETTNLLDAFLRVVLMPPFKPTAVVWGKADGAKWSVTTLPQQIMQLTCKLGYTSYTDAKNMVDLVDGLLFIDSNALMVVLFMM